MNHYEANESEEPKLSTILNHLNIPLKDQAILREYIYGRDLVMAKSAMDMFDDLLQEALGETYYTPVITKLNLMIEKRVKEIIQKNGKTI